MRRCVLLMCVCGLILSLIHPLAYPTSAYASGAPIRVVGWGDNAYGQTLTAPLTNVAGIYGGASIDTFYVRYTNGSLQNIGFNNSGSLPNGLTGVTSLATSDGHTIALKSNGTIVGWGDKRDDTPFNDWVPSLTNVTAIAASPFQNLALQSNGKVVGWGWCDIDEAAAALSNVIAITTSGLDRMSSDMRCTSCVSYVLTSDRTVTWIGCWGNTGKLDGFSNVKKIAGGGNHLLALKTDGTVIAYGDNQYGQTTIPAGLSDVIDIAAGQFHSLALKSNGTVVAWGNNWYKQTTIPSGVSGITKIIAGKQYSAALTSSGRVYVWGSIQLPSQTVNTNNTAVALGYQHTLMLKSNGTVTAWGDNEDGQSSVPANLTNVVEISAGQQHSLALKSNGTVVAWGDFFISLVEFPQNLTGVVAIASGYHHALALKSDGTVVGWGNGSYGIHPVPNDLTNIVAIAAGENHFIALKANGTVVAWGWESGANVPANLTDVVAIAAGRSHSLALRSNGTVVAWGSNTSGQSNVPRGLSGVVAIAAGESHSLALKSNGTVVAWGSNYYGQTKLPANLTNVKKIVAGGNTSYAIISQTAIQSPSLFGKLQPSNNATERPVSQTLSWGISTGASSFEYCLSLSANTCTNWKSTGTNRSVTVNNLQRNKTYFWQVRAKNASGTTLAIGNIWRFTTRR